MNEISVQVVPSVQRDVLVTFFRVARAEGQNNHPMTNSSAAGRGGSMVGWVVMALRRGAGDSHELSPDQRPNTDLAMGNWTRCTLSRLAPVV
jgi:hypothetical protein